MSDDEEDKVIKKCKQMWEDCKIVMIKQGDNTLDKLVLETLRNT
jgi:hypothetical protein